MANHGLNQYFRVVDLSDRLIVWFSHKTGDRQYGGKSGLVLL